MLTVPTLISEKIYRDSYFAIDVNANHWLINEEHGIRLWVGQYHESLEVTLEQKSFCRRFVTLVDECGREQEVECVFFPTTESDNELDLASLSIGEINWI